MTTHQTGPESEQSSGPGLYRVRRVPVTDPLAVAAAPYDYADAFHAELPPDPGSSPEVWLRAGLVAAPAAVRRVIGLLRRPAAGGGERAGLTVFTVVRSTPDVVWLSAELPMLRVSLIGRQDGPSERALTTVVHFRRRSARLLWLLVGPLHRRVARSLITSRGAGGTDPGPG